jgi:hypothetical protein
LVSEEFVADKQDGLKTRPTERIDQLGRKVDLIGKAYLDSPVVASGGVSAHR